MKKARYTRGFLFLFAFVIIVSSCKEEEKLWISFSNEMDTILQLNVHYKPGYEGLSTSDWFDTSYTSLLYESENLTRTPQQVLNAYMDSITVYENGQCILFFSPDSVFNYMFNPFTSGEIWMYSEYDRDFPTNFSSNTTRIHEFNFAIRPEYFVCGK